MKVTRKYKRKVNHQRYTKVFYRRLEKAWKETAVNRGSPDPLIKELFRLAIIAAHARRRIDPVMTFTHHMQSDEVNLYQKYRITTLGRIILIAPKSFYCDDLPSNIFKL